jgi:hypothetical protein
MLSALISPKVSESITCQQLILKFTGGSLQWVHKHNHSSPHSTDERTPHKALPSGGGREGSDFSDQQGKKRLRIFLAAYIHW